MESLQNQQVSPEIVQPEPIIETTTRKPSIFKKVLLIFFVVLIISGIGIGGYYLSKKSASTNPTAIPTKTPSIQINYDSEVIPLTQDIENAQYTTIEGTDLEIKIPTSYKQRKNGSDTFLELNHLITARTDIAQKQRDINVCKNNLLGRKDWADWLEPYLNKDYCNAFMATNPKKLDPHTETVPDNLNDFFIAKVATNSSPNDWILDNFHPQGINLRENPEWAPKSQQVAINNNIFYAYTPGCCAGGEIAYIYPYTYQRTKMLIFFIDEDYLPKLKIPDTFLNTVLTTLRKTN